MGGIRPGQAKGPYTGTSGGGGGGGLLPTNAALKDWETTFTAHQYSTINSVPSLLADINIGSYKTKSLVLSKTQASNGFMVCPVPHAYWDYGDVTPNGHKVDLDVSVFNLVSPVDANHATVRLRSKIWFATEFPGSSINLVPTGYDYTYDLLLTAGINSFRAWWIAMTVNFVTGTLAYYHHGMFFISFYRDYADAVDTYPEDVYCPFINFEIFRNLVP